MTIFVTFSPLNQPAIIICRWIQLSVGGPDFQAPILILPHHDLRARMHVGHSVVGIILARPLCCSCTCRFRGHNPFDHVHTDSFNQQLSPSSGLHQSHWCLAGMRTFLPYYSIMSILSTCWIYQLISNKFEIFIVRINWHKNVGLGG